MWMWSVLIVLAAIIFVIVQLAKKGQHLKAAMLGGLILAVLDIGIETLGAVLGLWTSLPYIGMIGGAPLSMLLIAFLAGTFFLQLLPEKSDVILVYVMAVALLCTLVEFTLVQEGLMSYLRWNSTLCFFSYIPVLYFLIWIYKGALLKVEKKKTKGTKGAK